MRLRSVSTASRRATAVQAESKTETETQCEHDHKDQCNQRDQPSSPSWSWRCLLFVVFAMSRARTFSAGEGLLNVSNALLRDILLQTWWPLRLAMLAILWRESLS